MVGIHYRWDFIGLSTDQKPTPQTSEKVVNGSTFYCSDNSKLYVFCDGTWYERKPLGGGGGGGSYVAGNGIDITDDTISVDTTTIQPKLTAGSNVTISDDTISATDTTYSAFTGTDGTAAGTAGLVPAPATTDAGKFLSASGLWEAVQAGGGVKELTSTDYNYPAANPDGVAMWKLTTGFYSVATGTKIYVTTSSNSTSSYRGLFLLHSNGYQCSYLMIKGANDSMQYWDVNIGTGTVRGQFYIAQTVDNLTSSSEYSPLSANQGKVLNDKITPSTGASAPTTSTTGTLGKIYIDSSTDNAYICTKVDGNTYTWKQITT